MLRFCRRLTPKTTCVAMTSELVRVGDACWMPMPEPNIAPVKIYEEVLRMRFCLPIGKASQSTALRGSLLNALVDKMAESVSFTLTQELWNLPVYRRNQRVGHLVGFLLPLLYVIVDATYFSKSRNPTTDPHCICGELVVGCHDWPVERKLQRHRPVDRADKFSFHKRSSPSTILRVLDMAVRSICRDFTSVSVAQTVL